MRRGLCVLWLGLLLGGCDKLTGGDDASDGGTSNPPPATPKWAKDNPTRANDNKPRLRVETTPFASVSFFEGSSSYTCNLSPVDVVAADEDGVAVLETSLADDSSILLYAKARLGGKDSSCSSGFSYIEDSTAPTKPTWDTSMPKVGTANALKLSGNAQGAFAFAVHASSDCSGPELGRPTVDSWGKFDIHVSVEDDSTNPFTIRAVDSAGNVTCSQPHVYVEDSTAPGPPVLMGTDPASPSRASSLFLLGRTEPGATVTAYTAQDCSVVSGTSSTADAEGRFRVGVNPSNYNATSFYYLRARDAAGHLSPCVGPQRYLHDSLGPTLSELTGFIPGSPANHNAPLLAGSSQGGAVVAHVYDNDVCGGDPLSTVAVDAAGKFQVRFQVPDDTSSRFYIELVDAAGNGSSCRAAPVYVEDSTAPSAPAKLSLFPGPLGAGQVVSIRGEGPSGETALLFSTPNCQGTPVDSEALSHSSGVDSFQLDATVAAGSTTVLSVAVRDAAGNTSACGGPFTYVHDSVGPSTSGVVVVDGPGEDLAHQLSNSVVEAHWSEFADAHGPVTYLHSLTRHANCETQTPTTAEQQTAGPSVRLTGLALLYEGPYYHCVRARDAVGNLSGYVRSNGFRVDLTPPSVAGSTPIPGEKDVDILEPIVLVFSEPMDAASVTTDSLTVEAGGARVEGAVSCAGELCTFQATRPLPYREAVRVTVSTAVRDVAGRPLASAYTLNFTTRGRQWSASPAQVQTVRPGLVPDVAVDGQGAALAVWVQGGADGTFRPYAARRPPHGAWSAPQVLDTQHAGEADRPVVAVNAAGVGVAVWELRVGADTRLYAAEYAPESGWSAPKPIEQGTGPVGHARVAVDAQGHALVLFQQRDGATASVWAVRRVAGVGWGSPLRLEASVAPVGPVLTADGAGNALAAWVAVETDGTRSVWARRFNPQGSWAAVESVAALVDEAAPAVALSADGSATAVFRRRAEDGSLSILARRFVPGAGWEAEALLGRGSPTWGEVAVAMDRWGRALVAWTGLGGSGPVLRLARYTSETGWQEVDVATGGATQPVVGADGQGNFHLLWVENVSGEDRVHSVRYPEGATALGAPRVLESAHGGTSKRPRLAVSAGAGASAVWYRDNGEGFSSNLVYASTYE